MKAINVESGDAMEEVLRNLLSAQFGSIVKVRQVVAVPLTGWQPF